LKTNQTFCTKLRELLFTEELLVQGEPNRGLLQAARLACLLLRRGQTSEGSEVRGSARGTAQRRERGAASPRCASPAARSRGRTRGTSSLLPFHRGLCHRPAHARPDAGVRPPRQPSPETQRHRGYPPAPSLCPSLLALPCPSGRAPSPLFSGRTISAGKAAALRAAARPVPPAAPGRRFPPAPEEICPSLSQTPHGRRLRAAPLPHRRGAQE